MRKLSENEIKQISGGDGNDGQAELIAIGSLAGTFISPGFGSIAGAYIGDKVHSWATTATVSPSMSPSGIGLSSSLDPAEVHQVPLRLRGVEVKPYIVNEAPVTGASLYDNGAYVTL